MTTLLDPSAVEPGAVEPGAVEPSAVESGAEGGAVDRAVDLRQAVAWGRRADISARSALVTILGDTIAPLGGPVWLADLITLAEPFGFSERLVRTSMFRLVSEGWVASERVGRRSRYALTPYGADETAAAEHRIYRPRDLPWDGSWTLVFLADDAVGTDPDAEEAARHLRWRGFARMADGVHARPNDHVAEARRLLDRLAIDPAPPVAAARFDGDGEAPLAGSPFRTDSGLAEAEDAYRRVVRLLTAVGGDPAARSGPPDPADPGGPLDPTGPAESADPTDPGGAVDPDHLAGLAPVEAFALRTMLVHDLRRARLRDPELPPALLPDDWIGHRAGELAASAYRAVTGAAWSFVAGVTGLTVDPDDPRLTARFPTRPPGSDPT